MYSSFYNNKLVIVNCTWLYNVKNIVLFCLKIFLYLQTA